MTPQIVPENQPAAPSLEELGVRGFVEPKLRIAQDYNPNSDSEEEYHAAESEKKKLEEPWDIEIMRPLMKDKHEKESI